MWNLATEAIGEQMNQTSAALPADVDEFDHAGLTAVDSDLVRPSRVAQSPVNFECLVTEAFQLRSAAGESVDTWMVLGEVVKVHISTTLLGDDLTYDTALPPRPCYAPAARVITSFRATNTISTWSGPSR